MATQTNNLTLSIIYYYIFRLDGILGKTRLQKMMFLTDLLASKKFKEKFTNLQYKKFHFGPFAPELDSCVNKLSKDGFIDVTEYPLKSDPSKKYVRYRINKSIDIRQKLIQKLGIDKFVLVDNIVTSFGNLSLQELLDFVYQIPCVKESHKEDVFQMAVKIDKTETEEEESVDFPFI